MLLETTQKIEQLLTGLRPEKLWASLKFYPYALYDSANYYLVTQHEVTQKLKQLTPTIYRGKTDERFLGNTAIDYEGSFTAIWDATTTGELTEEEHVAMIVHEMFHAFQQEKGEQRFPNELLGINYPLTSDNLMLRYVERKCLFQACTAENKTVQVERLAQFFQIRAQRQQLIGEHLSYEKAIESVEGTAVYVEFKALQELSSDVKLEEFIGDYLTLSSEQLKIRLSTYHQGLLLAVIADQLLGHWQESFIDSQDYLSDFIEKALGDQLKLNKILESGLLLDYDAYEKRILANYLQKWEAERDAIFAQFELNKRGQLIATPVQITGIDPMNIIMKDQTVIHKHFLRIKQGDEERVLTGPVKTEIGKQLFEVHRIEW